MAKVFSKVTPRVTYLFDRFTAKDSTNLTITYRVPADYTEKTGYDIEQEIHQHAAKLKRPLKILDAGCGECVVLDKLLSNESFKAKINLAIGISKDYFSPVKKVMSTHGKRFHYYHGRCQDVLKGEKLKVDILFDIWGALSYSKDKIALIKQYYEALAPNGKAFIHDVTSAKVALPEGQGHKDLYTMLSEDMPDVFSVKTLDSGNQSLMITKSRARLNLSRYQITSHSQDPSIGVGAKEYTEAELIQGNAMKPSDIYYALSDFQPPKLRSKAYS